jgi:cytochrome c5
MAAGGAAGNSAQAGQGVYAATCVACHAAGVAGAPKLGDKADWGPRVAQGNDTLYQHALNGFTGKKGTMPPKGGNAGLPDSDVRAAVDYMVSQAR